jgi:putative ABC transport system permease protein
MSLKKQNTIPPRVATKLLRWFLRDEFVEEVIGDLKENFDYDLEAGSHFRAKLNYWKQVILYLRPFAIRVPKFVNLLITWIMIGSHIKTSVRNVTRNKLFSTINIVGLAIGMSVGLLLIAFAHDLLSYDRFNEKGNRIYRITSDAKFRGGHRDKFATSSIKIGNLIQEKVTGVEEIVMIRTDFSGDAKINDSFIPFTGIYAEPSMLRIFTMPMLRGDAATALKEPYSIVLTEISAKKLFGAEDAFGKTIRFNNVEYQVTGIMKDIPFFSHIQFESIVSFSTIEPRITKDRDLLKWENVYQRNYIYLLLPENSTASDVQAQINTIAAYESKADGEAEIHFSLLPLHDVMLGEELTYSIGPVMPEIVLWIISGLTLVVILSACFNYTNLSIARSMRRYKEVGLRKVIGAGRGQVRQQFLFEAVILSLVALLLSFGMFLVLRPQFISIAPQLLEMVKLEITLPMVLMFAAFSMAVGIVAGFLPAVFFAKVNIIHALRDVSSVKVFKGVNFRRLLVVVQYTFTLIFITSTIIGFIQYKKILAFDLGFNTGNILNIDLQKNKSEALINKLKVMPEVSGVSQSRLLTSVGNIMGGFIKYKGLPDSALVFTNIVDENYIPLHEYKLIAGQNFITRPVTKAATSELIVNEKTLKQFNIANGDPEKAIGEEILLNNKKLTIVGVMKDFHYGKLDSRIFPVVFTYLTPDSFLTGDGRDGLVNVRVNSDDPVETMAKIGETWKSIDPVHPFKAQFYDDAIEEAYSELSAMIKIIGFLSFIAISIASLGLLGMVVFTTETRLREISIRKVLGATSANLVFLLSRGFVILLAVSALIALPITYLFFENVVLTNFPFHDPIGIGELFGGLLAVLAIAFIMIGSQTLRAAQSNPAEILKSE